MTETSPSPHEADAKGCDCKTDRVDLVRTLRDLTALELDSSNRTPKLEFARLTLRQKLPPNVLAIHDKFIAQGKTSIAPRFANACTECSGEVAIAPNTERIAEMFVECPHCGTLLYG